MKTSIRRYTDNTWYSVGSQILTERVPKLLILKVDTKLHAHNFLITCEILMSNSELPSRDYDFDMRGQLEIATTTTHY